MSDHNDDLGLDALLAAERAADDAPTPAAADRLYARVMATAAAPPPGTEAAVESAAASGAGGGAVAVGAGKLWLVVGLLAIGGGVAVWRTAQPETPPARATAQVQAPTPAPPPSAPPPVKAPPLAEPEPPAAPTSTAPASTAPPSRTVRADRAAPAARRRPRARRTPSRPKPAQPKPTVAPTDADLAAERRLLGEAAAALQGGRSVEALRLLAAHAARFPKGRLAEERAVVQVRALQQAGRADAARAAAQRFLRRYPKSLHRASVAAALEATAP